MTCNYEKIRGVWQACGVTEWGGAVGSSVETEYAFPRVGWETGDLVLDFWVNPESENVRF